MKEAKEGSGSANVRPKFGIIFPNLISDFWGIRILECLRFAVYRNRLRFGEVKSSIYQNKACSNFVIFVVRSNTNMCGQKKNIWY